MSQSNWSEIAQSSTSLPALVQQVLRHPRRFHFFQAMLLLSRAFPHRLEPGSGNDQRREVVFLRSWPSMVRSGTDIRSIRLDPFAEDGDAFEMEVSFLGLYGLSSPTPSYFWEYVLSHPDSALRELLDIFGSRWIGLFFQSWKRYRWPLSYQGGLRDPMTRRAFCLFGLGTELAPKKAEIFGDSFEGETTILAEHPTLRDFPNRLRLLAYAGILAQYTRPACNLAALLSDYFDNYLGQPGLVEIEENVLQWAYLAPRDQNKLGQANSRIGAGFAFVAGTRVRDRMGAYRVHIGALSLGRFVEFLPDRATFRTLIELARLGSPVGLEFDIDLKLKTEEVPQWKLGEPVGSGLGRLGWTCWAGDETRTEPGVVRLRPAW